MGIRFTGGVRPTGTIRAKVSSGVLLPDYTDAVETKLLAFDGAADDRFGYRCAMSGDGNTCIVCAVNEDTKGSNSGSAYIFVKDDNNDWSQQQKLMANVASENDQFGIRCDMSADGNTCIVGVQQDDDNGDESGSAYVFYRINTVWVQQKLLASDGAAGDFFGDGCAISGDGNTCIVGAHRDENYTGAAYIFTRDGNNWTEQQKITVASSEVLGHSCAMSGDGNICIIGAYYDDNSLGSAYIFTRSGSTWSQQAKLTASDRAGSDFFGWRCDMSDDGNTCIISARSRAAYIFIKVGDNWTEQQKLLANNASGGNNFGESCSISGDGNTCIVSAHYDNDKGNNAGAAYIFIKDNDVWVQQRKLTASDGAENDWLGYDCAMSGDGNTCIVGSHFDDDKGGQSGSAYIYEAK